MSVSISLLLCVGVCVCRVCLCTYQALINQSFLIPPSFTLLFFSLSFSLTGAVPPAQTTGIPIGGMPPQGMPQGMPPQGMPPQGINPPPSHGAMGGEYRGMKCVGVHSLRCPCVPASPHHVHPLFSFITFVYYLCAAASHY